MSFTELIDSLQKYKGQTYHLEQGTDKAWKVAIGAPSVPGEESLKLLALDFSAAALTTPLPIPALDLIQTGMQNLSLQPPSSGLGSLIRKSVKSSETESYRCFVQALDKHIDNAFLAHFEQSKRALCYLVETDDLVRFARLYRAIYFSEQMPQPFLDQSKQNENAKIRALFEKEMQEFINLLIDKFPTCMWLRRVKDDPEWPCGLVANPLLAMGPKRLDFRECDLKTIQEVLLAHIRQKYTQLMIVLNLGQEDFICLARSGCLAGAIHLDLRLCRGLEWNKIEGPLAKLKGLQNINLPSSLVVGSGQLLDSGWQGEIKETIKASLTRLSGLQQSLRDFMYVSNLMRGIKGTNVLNNTNRIQVNFLLSAKERLGQLSPLGLLSASGIQRTTVDLISQILDKRYELQLYLSYCPNITKEGLAKLCATFQFESLFLQGCSQVDDSYFLGNRLLREKDWFTGSLDLIATSVTETLITHLQQSQPRAKIIWEKSYLPRRANAVNATGIDRQGLSEEALAAVAHLKYSGYFPLISLKVAMELILHPLLLLAKPLYQEKLRQYCRYILQINVDRQNVGDVYVFARKTDDVTLSHICKIYIETFFPPDVAHLWNQLTPEEKENFGRILSEPIAGEPNFTLSEDILYTVFNPEAIHFSKEAYPLIEHVKNDDIVQFVVRFVDTDPVQRQLCVERLVQEFPHCQWLKFFQKYPERAELLASKQFGVPVVDLRDCPLDQSLIIIKAYQKTPKLELILGCTHDDLLSMLIQIKPSGITFLDLRACRGVVWDDIQPILLQMNALLNVLLPRGSDVKISKHWSDAMTVRLELNAFHSLMPNREGAGTPSRWRFKWFYELNQKIKLCLGPNEFTTGEFLQSSLAGGSEKLVSVLLSYSDYFTKEDLRQLLNSEQITKLTLFGCAFIDDSYFAEALPSTMRELDLRGTQVTHGKVEALRHTGLLVLYDEAYPVSRRNWETACSICWSKLSTGAFAALLYFNYTGYYPLLLVPVAMELIRFQDNYFFEKRHLRELQVHCMKFLVLSVSRDNVVELYQFAKELKEPILLSVCHYFIEFYCHPYYSEPRSDHEKAIFHEVIREMPPALYHDDISYESEKKKPPEPAQVACDKVNTANFDGQSSEAGSGL